VGADIPEMAHQLMKKKVCGCLTDSRVPHQTAGRDRECLPYARIILYARTNRIDNDFLNTKILDQEGIYF